MINITSRSAPASYLCIMHDHQKILPAQDIHQWFRSDTALHQLYPQFIQDLAPKHWTPISITRKVVDFLVPKEGVNVLDIGSGAGKFCLAAAYLRPQAFFYGVEQRKHLVNYAEKARQTLNLQNAFFLHLNLTQLNFSLFDHFYFYNSFYENLLDTGKIDDTVRCSPTLYDIYYRSMFKKLSERPAGTRVVTYHCLIGKMPHTYKLVDEEEGSLLKFWEKIKA